MAAIGSTALAWPMGAGAQQARPVYRIGVLTAAPRLAMPGPLLEAFLEGLRERGYVEGQNATVEVRYAEGKLERLPALAAELVALDVDVIMVAGPGPIQAAKAATSKIPIVMAAGSSDPIGEGLIASYARPGGNITGLTYTASPERFGKQLELLQQAIGRVSRVAIFWDLDVELFRRSWKPNLDLAASRLDMQIAGPVVVRHIGEFERAFEEMIESRADAILVASGGVILANRARAGELAIRHRLPMMGAFREMTQAGSLISYGPDFPDIYRRSAHYVDRILKGANPAEMPVEQPAKYLLVVNLKTAKALGVTISESILARADEVIE